MRGQLLTKVLEDLRVVLGVSLAPGHNINVRETHVNALRKTQEWLWTDFDWPHLRVERQMSAAVGQRYYSTPSDLAIDRIERVSLFYDTTWCPLYPDITDREYSLWNSDLDQRSWPPRAWRIAVGNEDDGEQLEVWPVPDQTADPTTHSGYLKLVGVRNLKPFRDETDTLDLDDQLVVLYTAVKLVGDPKKTGVWLNQANQRSAKLRGQMSKRDRFPMFGTTLPERLGDGRPIAVYQKPGTFS